MIVPMRHGGGTRLKILEAMAYGLPVITTSTGCAGLGLEGHPVAVIADSPAEFAAAVDRLVEDDRLWKQLSQAGRQFVEERFDWRVIGEGLDRVMHVVLAEL
jgi:glycosyltransferase involved in cell wall biosynthesis